MIKFFWRWIAPVLLAFAIGRASALRAKPVVVIQDCTLEMQRAGTLKLSEVKP